MAFYGRGYKTARFGVAVTVSTCIKELIHSHLIRDIIVTGGFQGLYFSKPKL
jgi:hypothetical protein